MISKTQEFLSLRFRYKGLTGLSGGGTIHWYPHQEGSYLSLTATDALTYTLNYHGSVSSAENRGSIIRVEFYQGLGGAGITWPSDFKFQTAGDALPNSTLDFLTAWEGLRRPHGSGEMLMTKLGEWDLT